MRLIDTDALMEEIFDELSDGEVLYSIPPDRIDDAPTIDAVEVVRCVNCVWCCEWRTKPGVFLCGRPNNGGLVVKPDFFCKHGECKEVENGKSN